jgi:hypothetical protein
MPFCLFCPCTFFNGNKIQVLVHILQSLTDLFWVEFPHETISFCVLTLPLKCVSPSTLDVKSADHCPCVSSFCFLGPVVCSKMLQTASHQHCLGQIHNHFIVSTVATIIHFLIQSHSPSQEFFWSPCVIFLDLHQICLGVLVFMIHGYLERTKLRVSLFFIFLCFHSKLCLQLIIEECNGSRKHNVLLLPRIIQNASIILIIVALLAVNHHLLTFAPKGMGVILLCPMHIVKVK